MKRVEKVAQILRSERKNITYKECCLILAMFRVIQSNIRRYKIKVALKRVHKPKAISVNFNNGKIYYYPIY
jgi:hypothetical protein